MLKRWSDERRKRAIALLFDASYSCSVAAKRVGVPIATVKRWLRVEKKKRREKAKAEALGKKWEPPKNVGNPMSRRSDPPLSERDRKKIALDIEQHPRRPLRASSIAIRKELRLAVSPSTLSRIAREQEIEASHRSRKPALSAADEKKRDAFAHARIGDDWSDLVAVDEILVDLNGSPNLHNTFCWHKKGTPVPPIPTHKFPISRNYFLACSARGALDPIPCSAHPTAAEYTKMLDQKVIPAIEELFEGDSWRFYQDLAPWHTAQLTQEFCQETMPGFFSRHEVPPRSPDLNPQESINGEIQQAIALAEPKTAAELEAAFFKAYREATTPAKLANIFASMPARCQAVIEAKGKMTRY